MPLISRLSGRAAPATGGLFKRTSPLFMKPTQVTLFKRTNPNHGLTEAAALIISVPFMGGAYPLFPGILAIVQWFYGGTYAVYPWLILWVLVFYLLFYGCRVADYDRGQMLHMNQCYEESDQDMWGMLNRETRMWSNICEHFLRRGEGDIKSGKWVRAEDGSVEPSPDNISPGGLAAFHLVSSMSLRWDLMNFVKEWNDSWVRKCHNVLIQPTWIIGGNEDVHTMKRSYVGDWTEEYFPYSRSSPFARQIPYAHVA